MFDEYSIEQEMNNIDNPKTKEYFKEVWSCYSLGNYRSAIVMLWSVTITDLLLKLKVLSELYENNPAKEIIKKYNSGAYILSEIKIVMLRTKCGQPTSRTFGLVKGGCI